MNAWSQLRHLPRTVLVAAVFLCAFGNATLAQADTVAVQFDWSGVDGAMRQRIADLQASGALPVPLIFVRGRPVGMLGDPIEIDRDAMPETMDVGISSLQERPLYSVALPAGASAGEAQVTWSRLVAHDHAMPDKLTLVLEGVTEPTGVPITVADGVATISLPPQAYLMLADAVGAQQHLTRWLTWAGVDVYQRDPANGATMAPIFTIFGTPGDVLRAQRQGDLSQPYAKNIDANWLGDQWRNFFLPEPPTMLLIRSSPSAAEVHIAGVKQSATTEAIFPVLRSLWPEIFIRKEAYRPCQVDPQKVVPPNRTGEPSIFVCKLQKMK
ncbi:MAG: hypothetical protein HYU58_12295 [Proteobacteria bacterium]|nr:hypothetical protein [Pseudomonadota bacterium]